MLESRKASSKESTDEEDVAPFALFREAMGL